jgi:hypothetical protein
MLDHKDLCQVAATIMAGILANPNNRIRPGAPDLQRECLTAAHELDIALERATLHREGFPR